ncbi:MAG: PLDc N-terminal domain-containing protein [Acidimicrobiales bacterium]
MPVLDIFWSMLFFAIWVAWIVVFVQVVLDIFRSHELGGLAKALWVIFILFLPFLGVFVYLVTRGGFTSGRSARETNEQGGSLRVGSTTVVGL